MTKAQKKARRALKERLDDLQGLLEDLQAAQDNINDVIDELKELYPDDDNRDVKDCLESCTNATGELGFAIEQLESFTDDAEAEYYDKFGDDEDDDE